MPPAIIPLVIAAGGMVAQNVQNKANIKNAENAQTTAQTNVGNASKNALNFWQNKPGIQAPNLSGGPASFGGGTIGGPSGGTVTGGQYGAPQGGGQQMTPQMIQAILQMLGPGGAQFVNQGGNNQGQQGIIPGQGQITQPGHMHMGGMIGTPQMAPSESPLRGFSGEPRRVNMPGAI